MTNQISQKQKDLLSWWSANITIKLYNYGNVRSTMMIILNCRSVACNISCSLHKHIVPPAVVDFNLNFCRADQASDLVTKFFPDSLSCEVWRQRLTNYTNQWQIISNINSLNDKKDQELTFITACGCMNTLMTLKSEE